MTLLYQCSSNIRKFKEAAQSLNFPEHPQCCRSQVGTIHCMTRLCIGAFHNPLCSSHIRHTKGLLPTACLGLLILVQAVGLLHCCCCLQERIHKRMSPHNRTFCEPTRQSIVIYTLTTLVVTSTVFSVQSPERHYNLQCFVGSLSKIVVFTCLYNMFSAFPLKMRHGKIK